jgi:ubiquinone/menaquinone biosynthesis C-methylase UbiE
MSETIVRKQYDQLAGVYDLRWKSYITNTLSFLKKWAEISPTDTILDVACGTGEFERLLLAEYSSQQIVGIDISDKCWRSPNRNVVLILKYHSRLRVHQICHLTMIVLM